MSATKSIHISDESSKRRKLMKLTSAYAAKIVLGTSNTEFGGGLGDPPKAWGTAMPARVSWLAVQVTSAKC